MWACERDYRSCAKDLIQAGADIDARNKVIQSYFLIRRHEYLVQIVCALMRSKIGQLFIMLVTAVDMNWLLC
jgi:hypothetical protein